MSPLSPSRRILMLLAAAAFLGCEAHGDPAAPDPGEPVQAKGGNGKGGGGGDGGDGGSVDPTTLRAFVVVADHWGAEDGTAQLASVDGTSTAGVACSLGAEVSSSFSLLFRKTRCLVVPLDDGTSLKDDVVLGARSRKGRVEHYALSGHEDIGADWPMHESDPLVLPAATRVDLTPGAETVVHVHAVVEVWQLSSHLGGKRVAMKGRIAVGDVRYVAPAN